MFIIITISDEDIQVKAWLADGTYTEAEVFSISEYEVRPINGQSRIYIEKITSALGATPEYFKYSPKSYPMNSTIIEDNRTDAEEVES